MRWTLDVYDAATLAAGIYHLCAAAGHYVGFCWWWWWWRWPTTITVVLPPLATVNHPTGNVVFRARSTSTDYIFYTFWCHIESCRCSCRHCWCPAFPYSISGRTDTNRCTSLASTDTVPTVRTHHYNVTVKWVEKSAFPFLN